MTTPSESGRRSNGPPAAPSREGLDLIRPSDARYDDARSAWNLSADQRPAAICRARSVEDVQSALGYAREWGWRVAAQTTGHLAQVLPDLSDALLLKLALSAREVVVDPVRRTAQVHAGATWGDVVDAVAPQGLTAMHGTSASVGVIGYLLGGGLSFYGRAHGLACNHVLGFEVVTPDGHVRHVDADSEPDLFYVLRGGGGGYAVVTEVEIELLPYSEVSAGAMFFSVDHVEALLRKWNSWCRQASESITTTFRLLNLPPVPEVPEPLRGMQTVCVDGVDLEGSEADGLETQLRGVAAPILGGFGPMPAAAVASLHGDPQDPMPGIGDGSLLAKLDDRGIDCFLDLARDSVLAVAELRHLGGALARSPAGAGALDRFKGEFLVYGAGVPGAPVPAAELNAYLDRFLLALKPWESGSRFLSFAERTYSLDGAITPEALERARHTRAILDPVRLLIGPLDGASEPHPPVAEVLPAAR